jgi:3-methyladenine DNA glycosylase/8-oxoguanine DNA glycosylase
VDLPWDQAEQRLRAIAGIGVWTAAEVRHTALGDPDAVSFGDYHVARDIGWALTGAEVDDDGLAELLEPYAGHRYRVQGLLELAGFRRPRRGPRMAARTHLPHRFR